MTDDNVIHAEHRFTPTETPDETKQAPDPLTALRESNAQTLHELEQQGAGPPMLLLLKLRLDTLTDLLFAEGAFASVFEFTFESRMHEYLESYRSQAAKAKLLQGVHVGPDPTSAA